MTNRPHKVSRDRSDRYCPFDTNEALQLIEESGKLSEEVVEQICFWASDGALDRIDLFVPILIRSLDQKEHWVRQVAVAALGHIGIDKQAKAALPAITYLSDDPDPRVREIANLVLCGEFPRKRSSI